MHHPVTTPRPSASYSIDRENRLCAVDEGWLRFAHENGAPELTTEAILGRPITTFIADPTTCDLLLRLYERVRKGARFSLPFRCDAPALRRELVLELSLDPEGNVRCQTFVLREQPRQTLRLLDPGAPRGEEFLRMCSWCKKIALGGQWHEVEDAVRTLNLFSSHELPRISHGMCPTCAAGFHLLEQSEAPEVSVAPDGRSSRAAR